MQVTITMSARSPLSLGATAEVGDVFVEAERNQLEGLRHRRVDVDLVDEVLEGRPQPDSYRRLMYDLAGIATDEVHAEDPMAVRLGDHLDHATWVAYRSGPGDVLEAHGTAGALVSAPIGLCIRQTDARDLG